MSSSLRWSSFRLRVTQRSSLSWTLWLRSRAERRLSRETQRLRRAEELLVRQQELVRLAERRLQPLLPEPPAPEPLPPRPVAPTPRVVATYSPPMELATEQVQPLLEDLEPTPEPEPEEPMPDPMAQVQALLASTSPPSSPSSES